MEHKTYRPGPVAALMAEYERAANELKKVVRSASQEDFIKIADPNTKDPDCRSIQTIMNHVVRAGYGYANYIRQHFGDELTPRKENYELITPDVACHELDQMLLYTTETLHNKWDLTEEEATRCQMKVSWGVTYDFEQLFEHAIVHILRHRRQIERFLIIVS